MRHGALFGCRMMLCRSLHLLSGLPVCVLVYVRRRNGTGPGRGTVFRLLSQHEEAIEAMKRGLKEAEPRPSDFGLEDEDLAATWHSCGLSEMDVSRYSSKPPSSSLLMSANVC